MNLSNHIPAYKRLKIGQFTGAVIETPLDYQPSIMRDVLYLFVDCRQRYSRPYTFERVIEIIMVIALFPLVSAFMVYQAAYAASFEKAEWNIEHSKFVHEMKAKGELFTYPAINLSLIHI